MRLAVLIGIVLASAAAPAVALALAQRTPEVEARELVNLWLADQNQGDFEHYQKLYAPDFVGVKRAGPRTTTFDRAGWLDDRRRMFAKKMKVEAETVRVFASAASARVVFVQRWSSGNYSDVGPKQLVLRRRGAAGWLIVREELVTSQTKASAAVDVEAFHRCAFVLDGEIVVSMSPDEAWAAGPPASDLPRKGVERTKRPVAMAKLPPEVARLVGTPVRLMDAHGVKCEAKLGAFLLRGRIIEGGDVYEEGAPPSWTGTANFLVAKIDGDRKACAGATWARAAALPVPVVTPAETPDAVLEKRALAAFGALPQARAIQERFAAWLAANPEERHGKGVPLWYARTKPARIRAVVRVLRAPAPAPTLVSVSANLWEGGCADGVFGSLWGLWRVDGPPDDPRLSLRNEPGEAMVLRPASAADVDGDGQLELFFESFTDDSQPNVFGQPQLLENGVVRALDGAYVDVRGPQTPIMICPC